MIKDRVHLSDYVRRLNQGAFVIRFEDRNIDRDSDAGSKATETLHNLSRYFPDLPTWLKKLKKRSEL